MLRQLINLFVCWAIFHVAWAQLDCPAGNSAGISWSSSEMTSTLSVSALLNEPWERTLVAIPATVNLLAAVAVLSGKRDFSLNHRPPVGGFQYIRNPDSFRAAMTQVCNDAWNAFFLAQRNMDTIQLNMLMIPENAKTIIKYIERAPPRTLRRRMQIPLNELKIIGQLCVDRARETEIGFKGVMDLLGEIERHTQVSRGVNEELLGRTGIELNQTMTQLKSLEEIGTGITERLKEFNAKVTEAENRVKIAMSEIPTGWKHIGQEFTRGFGKAFNGLISGAGSYISGNGLVGTSISLISSKLGKRGDSRPSTGPMQDGKANAAGISSFSGQWLNSQIKMLGDIFTTFSTSVMAVLDGKSVDSNKFQADIYRLKTLRKVGSSGQGREAEGFGTFMEVVGRSASLAERMKTWAVETNGNSSLPEEEKTSINTELQNIGNLLAPLLITAVQSGQGMNSLSAPEVNPSQFGSGVGSNERFKVEVFRRMTTWYQESATRELAEFRQNQAALTEVTVKIAGLDLEKVGFEEIIPLIRQGLILLGQIREQWSILTSFFAAISVQTELTVERHLKPFTANIEAETQDALFGSNPQDRMFVIEDILKPALKDLVFRTSFLQVISKTYVTVSQRHIIQQLPAVTRLSALPLAEASAGLNDFNRKCTEAHDEIITFVVEKRAEFNRTISERLFHDDECLQQQTTLMP